MRVVTVTDAWAPQVNGVVRTIEATHRELLRAGHESIVLSAAGQPSVPCPGYDGIRLAVWPGRWLARQLDRAFARGVETAIHIATEGPVGRAARAWCQRRGVPFSSAYHTRFPQYLAAMFGVPERWTYGVLGRFHNDAAVVLAPTETVQRELELHGVRGVALWTRGVDVDTFQPADPLPLGLPSPLFLYVGRVSVEKNVAAFLALDLPGTKVVAGVGPALTGLRLRHPEACFVGVLDALRLARLYSAADVFVFPSRTDTFGLVLLEALACGTPVAAYPVQGPQDVIGAAPVGVLDENLRSAALAALRIDRAACRRFALERSWSVATAQFVAQQRPVRLGPCHRCDTAWS